MIRSPFGGGVRGGPFHACCPEGWFVGTAGLKVVCPGSVEDAYGLLRSAIEDDDPVLYFEHKALYRRLRAERARRRRCARRSAGRAVARPGTDATLSTYGASVDLALRAADALASEASVEVLDLRTVWPLDDEAILDALAGTSRVLRAAGGELVARRRRPGALARRARGLRAARRPARPDRSRPTRRCRSPPSSRTPTSRRSTVSSSELRKLACLLIAPPASTLPCDDEAPTSRATTAWRSSGWCSCSA